ncbi:alpha/beta fold hydrolase [Pararhizobium arenae]|uniref:alpha/beta fold hydrolase n=1 Tax=Pararhizobium arenae TaxID=1856850 RepID=UPI00094B2775|nr:alpha/beta hydrolase [Pararhizobium arenae]
MFEVLRDRLKEAAVDEELPRLSAGLEVAIRFEVGEEGLVLQIADQRAVVLDAYTAGEVDIRVAAPADTWAKVFQAPPPATFHSFTAFQLANAEFQIEGAAVAIARARPVLERVIERTVRATAAAAPSTPRDLAQIAGRYRALHIGGQRYDIYFEEAGHGTPVLFLHTAGADGRQFQPQLSDIGLAENHRLIAVDLPFHGKSMPPLSWGGGIYTLSSEMYLAWCAAIIEEIVGEQAIVAGGSMGAAMALTLAAKRPSLLRGIIAIEPPFRSKGRRNAYQNHAHVHGSLHNAAYVRGLMSPISPEDCRRRASWIYSQAAPGIYAGDLAFYSDEFDGAVTAPEIDAGDVPTVLLSGDYDYSATPADGAKLAALIPGSLHLTMPGLGHFPMCEHPDYFRSYLMAGLDHIARRSR